MTEKTNKLEVIPHQRKVLVCVAGTSPAVITETLYVLVAERQFIPDEIHVITTLAGKAKIEEKLFGSKGALADFKATYIPEKNIRFDESTIHLPKNERGDELEDITTREHNEMVANTIYSVMRNLKNENAQIHASIAGGRKTMSFYMGQAFSLVADHDDALSHVLVSPPFETINDFFFPNEPVKTYEYEDGPRDRRVRKTISSAEAKVSLADVAVLKLGAIWQENLPEAAKNDLSFAIQVAQAVYDPPELIISEKRKKDKDDYKNQITVRVMGTRVPLSPQELLVFLMIAYERKHGNSNENQGFDVSIFNDMKPIQSPVEGASINATSGHEIGQANITQLNSGIKSKFSKIIGPASTWFAINKSKREKHAHHYKVRVPSSKLFISLTSDTEEKVKALLALSSSSDKS